MFQTSFVISTNSLGHLEQKLEPAPLPLSLSKRNISKINSIRIENRGAVKYYQNDFKSVIEKITCNNQTPCPQGSRRETFSAYKSFQFGKKNLDIKRWITIKRDTYQMPNEQSNKEMPKKFSLVLRIVEKTRI